MNLGILGTGSIARTMAAEFAKVPAFHCAAVCSRQKATGEALAQQFGIPKVYTDYDAMLADPDIELVYIATPNSLHYAQTKAALLAGKNVLCEKPFVPTVAEIAMILALKDYDACYAALKKTRQVVTVLEAAREDAQLGF